MAAKKTEELVEEILKLKNQLKLAKGNETAVKAAKDWAKSLGYASLFKNCSTYEDYQRAFDELLSKELLSLSDVIEKLEFKLANETKAVDQLLKVKNQDIEDMFTLSENIIDLTEKLNESKKELDKTVALLDKAQKMLEHEKMTKAAIRRIAVKHKDINREYKALLDECRKKLAEKQLKIAELTAKYEKKFSEQDAIRLKIIASARKHKKTNEEFNLKAKHWKKENAFLTKRNAALQEEFNKQKAITEEAYNEIAKMVMEIAEKDVEIEKLMSITPERLYAQITALITDVFKSHGYKIASYGIDATNTEKTNRQNQLYLAIRRAKKEDAIAEDYYEDNVEYPENGFNNIRDEILVAYRLLAENYDSKSLFRFKQQYASAQDKKDGEVTDEEIIDTILKKEPNAKFINTKLGKVVALAGAAVAAAAIAVIVGLGARSNRAENRVKELENTTTSTIIEVEKNPYLDGDVITIPVGDKNVQEDFATYKRSFKTADVAVVRKLLDIKYNKATGDTEIVIEVITPNKLLAEKHINFTIDLKSVDPAILTGDALFDAATLFDAMEKAKEQGNGAIKSEIFVYKDQSAIAPKPEDDKQDTQSSVQTPTVDTTTDSSTASDIKNEDVLETPESQDPEIQDPEGEQPVEIPAPQYAASYEIVEGETNFAVICKVRITTVDASGKVVVTEEKSEPYVYKTTANREKAAEHAMNKFIEILEREMGIELE